MIQRLFRGLYYKKGRVHSLENGVMKKFIKIAFDSKSLSENRNFIQMFDCIFWIKGVE